MKAIQITFDEDLLKRFDAEPEVREHGRSAVLRRAVEMYLGRRRRARIAADYRTAYGKVRPNEDLAGWEDEGTWPDE